MTLLIKLLTAHLIGDFFLQPQQWVKKKESNKLKSPQFYLHILIHAILLVLILWDMSLWIPIVLITSSHFIIDMTKLFVQNHKNKRLLFFTDQLLHIIVIVTVYLTYTHTSISLRQITSAQNQLLLFCLLFLTMPVSIMMKTICSKWDIEELTKDNESLKDAGQYIGILERILVFLFIINNHWEAVGFLVTAKSVLRFGDLRESKHRKLTEYVLIGTLLSFGIAVVTGLLYLRYI